MIEKLKNGEHLGLGCGTFVIFHPTPPNAEKQSDGRIEIEEGSKRDSDVGGDRELFNWSHCSHIRDKVFSVCFPPSQSLTGILEAGQFWR